MRNAQFMTCVRLIYVSVIRFSFIMDMNHVLHLLPCVHLFDDIVYVHFIRGRIRTSAEAGWSVSGFSLLIACDLGEFCD